MTLFKKIFFVVLAVGCITIAAILTKTSSIPTLDPDKFASTQGDREDPQARVRFEYLRTRNPVTGKVPVNIRAKELAFCRTLPAFGENPASRGAMKIGASFSWSPAGPYNVGGRTRALGIDINNNYLLAGGVSGAMYRSTDNGQHWTNTTSPSSLHSISCLTQDSRSGKTSTWYYGTGEYMGNSASGKGAPFNGDGIFKSTDNGQSWQQLASTVSNTPNAFDSFFDYVWRIVCDPSNSINDVIYVATYGVILKSQDGGTHWHSILGGSPYSNFTDIAITSDGVLYATMNSSGVMAGIWRSTDGESWTNITPTGWPANYRRTVLAVAPSNENIVYFLSCTPNYGTVDHNLWKYTYVSGNGSGSTGTWVNLSSNLPAEGGKTGNFNSQKGYDLVIKVKPDDANTVFIGGTNLYRSTNGFSSTANTVRIGGYANNNYAKFANHYCDQHSLCFFPGLPGHMLSGHDGGISKTTNNTAPSVMWTNLNKGYYTSQFYTVALDPSGTYPHDILGGMQDNGSFFTRSASPTASWNPMLTGDGAYCAITNSGQYIYASSQKGVVYRLRLNSSGISTTWSRIDPINAQYNLFINPFIVDPNNGNRIYMIGRDRIWRNSDASGIPLHSNDKTSVNWTALTQVAARGDTMLTALAVSKTNPANRLYYGTHQGQIYTIDNADIGNPAPTLVYTHNLGGWVSCIAVDPENGNRAIAVYSNYNIPSLFLTTNGGASWSDISGNLEENMDGTGNGPSCRWATIAKDNTGLIYFVATSTGVYSTHILNGTSTQWTAEGLSNMGNVVVDMIVSRNSDGRVIAATHGKGIYQTYMKNNAVDNPAAIRPSDITLYANYPNPFNPETRIKYKITAPDKINLSIFNTRGQKIKELVNKNQAAGTYTVVWDGKTANDQPAASGVYIYKLTSGSHIRSGRCTLLK